MFNVQSIVSGSFESTVCILNTYSNTKLGSTCKLFPCKFISGATPPANQNGLLKCQRAVESLKGHLDSKNMVPL